MQSCNPTLRNSPDIALPPSEQLSTTTYDGTQQKTTLTADIDLRIINSDLRCEGRCSARHIRVLPIGGCVSVCFYVWIFTFFFQKLYHNLLVKFFYEFFWKKTHSYQPRLQPFFHSFIDSFIVFTAGTYFLKK